LLTFVESGAEPPDSRSIAAGAGLGVILTQKKLFLDSKEKRLKDRFENHRWPNIKKSSNKHDVKLPNKDELWEKLLANYRNGFICEYCGKDLKIKDSSYPYPRSFSIDHRESLFMNGSNDISNLSICCNACNQVKGTMSAELWVKVVKAIKEKYGRFETNKILREWQYGRLKHKLDREDELEREVEG